VFVEPKYKPETLWDIDNLKKCKLTLYFDLLSQSLSAMLPTKAKNIEISFRKSINLYEQSRAILNILKI
jgi:hypothetical protein